VTNPISRRTFTVGVAAGVAVAALPHTAAASTPDFTEATLWDATVGPLVNYHVHGLCVLPDDTILAATEGRYEVCDAGPRDILLRRSTDRGHTWEPSQTVRFTAAGAGRGGGQLISLDELSVVTARARPDVREEITIDTGELGYQAVSGTWKGSTGVPGYYGSNYLTHATGPGDAVVRYRPAIPGDDAYEVLVSHTADPNRASAAPYTVHHAGGATTVTVDQKVRGVPETRGGEWVSLGTFTFHSGIDGYVELTNSPTGVVIADAVRFRRRAQ
jgi:hypothetical protein